MSEETRYQIDPKRSRFTVKAFSGGLLSAFAHNPTIAIRKFTGEAVLADGNLEAGSLRFQVKADSLELADNVSKKDREEIERVMREEVLETSKYPDILFESTAIEAEKIYEGQYRVRINGRLSLHGTTGNCRIEAQVTASEDRLRSSGEFPLRQTDYNIKLVNAAGGTIKVKDELKFSFDILANRVEG